MAEHMNHDEYSGKISAHNVVEAKRWIEQLPGVPRDDCPNCGKILGPHDMVGLTFAIIQNAMLAFTLFFFIQASIVPKQWKTSLTVAGLVTGVAWYNYGYMKEAWIETQNSPTTYRYTDWLITVPLQIAEFYFILKAAGPVSGSLGLRLFTCSVLMILFGYLAEVDFMQKIVGFALGMASWLYILYEVFSGEACQNASKMSTAAAKQAFGTLRLIVSVGWCIYPLGFAIVYLGNVGPDEGGRLGQASLNITYNVADLVNKGAFGLCVWSAAIADKEAPLLG